MMADNDALGAVASNEMDSESIFDVTLPTHPYPGLRPFEGNEWPIFFGREVITGEVVERLIKQQFVALHGDSGCGKSSLVRAGVMPRLERDHARGGATWRTTTMLPRNAPLRNLATALAGLEVSSPEPDRVTELRRLLNLGSESATHLSQTLRRDENDYICVLIDQFEEIFHFYDQGGASEVKQFVEVLLGLQQTQAPGLHVILTMRSEFLGRCANFEGLAEAINETQYLLPRMEKQALSRAIREPARLYGGSVAPELADALIADSGQGQDQLPLMQHAVMLLHKQSSAGEKSTSSDTLWTLKLADYQQSGGVVRLLSEHAESVLNEVLEEAEDRVATMDQVARVFKALTDISPDGHAIRRPQTIAALMAQTETSKDTLLDVIGPMLADGVSFVKIFGREPYDQHELVDISHEALIRNWRRLEDWSYQEARDGAVYIRLLNLAEQHREDASILLGLGEAQDRERWWQETRPNDTWAERYNRGHNDISVSDVRALIDRSLDSELQAEALKRHQIEWIKNARAAWERGQENNKLLTGFPLYEAERLIIRRGRELSAEDREFITFSRSEYDRNKWENGKPKKPNADARLRQFGVDDPNTAFFRGELRENFIPITTFALMDNLTEASKWPTGQARHARRFFRHLKFLRHQRYSATLDEFENIYEPFNPDSSHLQTRKFEDDERKDMLTRIREVLRELLHNANYVRIERTELELLLSTDSHYGLDFDVDFEVFEALEVYYRSATTAKAYRRTFRSFLFRKQEYDVPVFGRLFILYKLKPDGRRIDEHVKSLGVSRKKAERLVKAKGRHFRDRLSDKLVYLKLFKDMPRADMEMIFPNTKVSFRLFDKIKLGVLFSGAIGMGVVGTVSKVAAGGFGILNPFALVGAMVAIGGMLFRQIMSFMNTRQRYLVVMAQNLFFHALADNRSVIGALIDGASEENAKEEMLLYTVLLRETVGREDLPAVGAAIEAFLHDQFGVSIDFDVESALARLQRDGFVEQHSDGKYEALPPREASTLIDQHVLEILEDLPDHKFGLS